MCLIVVPNVKEINPREGCFSWLKVISKSEQRRKYEENQAIFINIRMSH